MLCFVTSLAYVMSRRMLLNGIDTSIIEFTPLSSSTSDYKIVIIPGNPGNAGYYHEFAYHLYTLTERASAVSVISHAGHVPPVVKVGQPPFFSLKDQADHKLAYLALDSHKDSKIILIGHSMGCYVIQEMMKVLPQERVKQIFFLFPTIERMIHSPKGISYVSKTGYFCHKLLYYMTFFFHYCFPKSLLKAIISLKYRSLSTERSNLLTNSTVALLNPTTMSNVLQLSTEEMDVIYTRDDRFLQQHIDNIVFYYGMQDGWVPITFHDDMIRDYPRSNIHLCQKGLMHAFMFNGPIEMAQWVYNHI